MNWNNRNKEREDGVSGIKSLGILLLGPILGLAYVISMPFIVIGAVIVLTGERIIAVMLRLVSFGWRPREAYLGGKNKLKRKEKNNENKG